MRNKQIARIVTKKLRPLSILYRITSHCWCRFIQQSKNSIQMLEVHYKVNSNAESICSPILRKLGRNKESLRVHYIGIGGDDQPWQDNDNIKVFVFLATAYAVLFGLAK